MYYKIRSIIVGVSLTDNHHIRAIVMIQRSPSRCPRILYPVKGIGPELLIGSTSLCEKDSSKRHNPFLPMMATWFMKADSFLNYFPYRCSTLLPKILYYISSLCLKIYFFCHLRLVLKNVSQRLSWKSKFPLLLHLKKQLLFSEN